MIRAQMCVWFCFHWIINSCWIHGVSLLISIRVGSRSLHPAKYDESKSAQQGFTASIHTNNATLGEECHPTKAQYGKWYFYGLKGGICWWAMLYFHRSNFHRAQPICAWQTGQYLYPHNFCIFSTIHWAVLKSNTTLLWRNRMPVTTNESRTLQSCPSVLSMHCTHTHPGVTCACVLSCLQPQAIQAFTNWFYDGGTHKAFLGKWHFEAHFLIIISKYIL